jgi:pimeloyl-ACP methyl ester carboxylesterase
MSVRPETCTDSRAGVKYIKSADYWFDSSDGLRLFSRVYPGPGADAPVVLCLHGLMRNSRDFADLAQHLSARYRVIAPDMRGRGLSAYDPDSNNYQIPVYVRDCLALLAGLGASRVALIGTSMGGLMAMVLAVMMPELIQRVVLNDVGPELDPRGVERIRGYAGKSSGVRSWPEAIARVRSVYGAAWPGLSESRWEEIAHLTYRADGHGVPVEDADPRIAEPLAKSRMALDLWPMWRALARVPVLTLRGAHSDILSTETLARMQREKPDLKVLEVANRGHVPLLDEPECLAAIDEFLKA